MMRNLVYATLAILLAMLGIVGVREALSFRRASEERELRLAQDQLVFWVDQWEDAIAGDLYGWLKEIPLQQESKLPKYELDLRSDHKWFDAIYLWEPGEIFYPRLPAEENLALLRSDPCLAAAAAQAGKVDPIHAGLLYRACIGRDDSVSLLAASEAAELFLNGDAPLSAELVIRELGSLGGLRLREAPRVGVSARRLVFLRLQLARAEDMLGRTERAEYIVRALAREITSLDGALLESVLDLWDYPIARDLREYGGGQLGEDDERYLRAQRRLALYEEIRDRSLRDVPTVSQGPKLLVDQYGDPPYLLFYAKTDLGGMLSGVQLDQPELVRDLMEFLDRNLPAVMRPHVSVRDPAGRVLAGDFDPLVAEVAMTRILPHLRVGVSAGALALDSGVRTAMVQLLPIGVGIIIGVFSLVGLVRSDRQQAALMERQREFMTRVTHELKTPLAGIRLMAENLEMGSFRDDAQREKFARRIVTEAERLGQRLDEVIRAASRPLEEGAQLVDPTALAAGVAERWKPLFEQQGVALHVEIAPGLGQLRGKPSFLRDALTNLLDNALKYRNPERASEVWLRARGDRRWVEFEVEDNGIGVPTDMRKAIFERFRRVEGPGRGRSGGHGLGLAFVAESARMHGGKVECREGVDGGARFIFRVRRRS